MQVASVKCSRSREANCRAITGEGKSRQARKEAFCSPNSKLPALSPAGARHGRQSFALRSRPQDTPRRSVLLTFDFWQRRFNGDERVLGRPIRLASELTEVVGVLPSGFVFPSAFAPTTSGASGLPDCAILAPEPAVSGDRRSLAPIATGGLVMDPIVRLKAGVTQQRAQAEMDALASGVRPSNPRFADAPPGLRRGCARSILPRSNCDHPLNAVPAPQAQGASLLFS